MTELQETLEQAERHAHAPLLVKKVANEVDHEELAEVAAEIEALLRAECKEKRGMSKHAAQACCYMVVDRLAEAHPADDAEDQEA